MSDSLFHGIVTTFPKRLMVDAVIIRVPSPRGEYKIWNTWDIEMYCNGMWYRNYSNKMIDYVPNQVMGRYGTSDENIPVGAGQHVERQWASCQIRKIAGAHAPGMPGTFSPSPQVSDPDMHHGTCVTHVPWCMPGSLTSGFLWNRQWGKTFPAFLAHAQPAILRIW